MGIRDRHSIVLDVKIGSGAFMKTPEDGARLAERMVAIGQHCGRRVRAVMTDMDIPLGKNIGNALEVAEDVYKRQVRMSASTRRVPLCRSDRAAYAPILGV